MKKHMFIGFVLNLLFGSSLFALPTDSVSVYFQEQLAEFPQEKIYLHTDRVHYATKDTIWFRAYMTDASTHRPEIWSRYVYVELIGEADTVVRRIKVRPEKEAFSGYLSLGDVPDGKYLLRGYTNFMRSVGEAYFFRKQISVGRALEQATEKQEEVYDVSFFPEGGNFPTGVFCRVGFKALNASGLSEDITGMIMDEEGNEIVQFKSGKAGMGAFLIQPGAGKQYYAVCQNRAGVSKRFALPLPETNTCALQARMMRDKLRVSLAKSSDNPRKLAGYFLLVHCRGQICYANAWDDSKEYLMLDQRLFPTGVLQILLLDTEGNPVSERLVFSKNDDQGHLHFSLDKQVYGIRDHISAQVQVSDAKQRPLTGSFSVSVTDDHDVMLDNRQSIYSYLLLTSELRGYIESPASYFKNEEDEDLFELDCLMLTQGGRRYEVAKILKKEYAQPTEELELGQVISGKVLRPLLQMGVSHAQVGILAPSTRFANVVLTDSKGAFAFSGFEYPDSTSYIVSAITKNGNEHVEVVPDLQTFPGLSPADTTEKRQSYQFQLFKNQLDSCLEKADRRNLYRDISRTIDLEDVVVSAKKKEPKVEISPLVKDPMFTMTYKDIERFHPSDFEALLKLLPQFPSVGQNVMIDGIFVEHDFDRNMLNVNDIAQIDLIPEYRASIFGSRFEKAGVIAITTKKGGEGIKEHEAVNKCTVQPLGYQRLVRFYSPVYETNEQKNFQIPDLRSTLYWNPDVRLSKKGEASFDFYSADVSSTYSVVIEGITDDGKVICKRETITVH